MALRLMLLVHLLSVVFWVGGMAFVRFALAPALAAGLAPPQRLPLLVAILERFLAGVGWAIVLIVASGVGIVVVAGHGRPAVHAMTAIAVVMFVVFGVIRLKLFPALRRAVAAGQWPSGGAAALVIRRLVDVNLVLGAVTIAVALLAP